MTDDLSWASGEDPTLVGHTLNGCRIVVVRRTYGFGRFLGLEYWTSVQETKPGGCKPMAYNSFRFTSKENALAGARKQREHEELFQEFFKDDP